MTYPVLASDTVGNLGINTRKLGMWVFLASEVMFFTGLIGSYIILRAGTPSWPVPSTVLNIPLTALNTFILICSSATLVMAYAAIQRGDEEGLHVGFLLTILLCALFLGIQMKEYSQLIHHGFTINSGLFGSCFYTMTGFHGTHVFIGALSLISVFIKAARGGYTKDHCRGVEMIGLYWHFVDLVWIILFTIVYLI